VFVEIGAEVFGAVDDVVAVDLAGEGFVFHPLSDGLGVDFCERLAGLDEGNGGDESGELVTGEETFFHWRVATDAGVFGVGHDGAADFVGVSALFQDFVAFIGMLFGGGPAFVVEVVDESDDAPEIFGFGGSVGVFARTGAHAGLHGERVLAQALGLGELGEELPGLVAGMNFLPPLTAFVRISRQYDNDDSPDARPFYWTVKTNVLVWVELPLTMVRVSV